MDVKVEGRQDKTFMGEEGTGVDSQTVQEEC